jgi:DNA gyrase subunit A
LHPQGGRTGGVPFSRSPVTSLAYLYLASCVRACKGGNGEENKFMEIGIVQERSIVDEMRDSYLDYAMSVIVSRALPDVRDGLKPVQRRILYAMLREGLRHDQRYSKCAGIVGEVLKKYHPHGDSAVYDALVRLAQPWNMRYPLVDGQGNFGSIDGDPPAAYRYTEAKLTEIAEELLIDIDKNTVDFRPNFDGEHQEPAILPALLPNLLLNGAAGIAVGMATNVPPHNLIELCNAISYLIDNPEATVEDLIKIIPGPDFPTGASILGTEGIMSAYSTGKGQITLRARAHIEEGARGSFMIVVTELPYQVNKARLHERVAEMAKERKIEGIRDIQDQSDRSGMRLVFFLKQDAQPRKVLNALYKHSQMQTTFGVNMLALTDEGRQPRVLTLKRMLQLYIEHRQEVIRRRTEFDLEKARARAHILEGLKIALDNIDEIIRIIRGAASVDEARTSLIARFELSELQAQAILDMQLRRLAALERQKIEDEYRELIKLIAELEDILANPNKVLHLIQQDMAHLREKYGDERRTRIIPDVDGEVSDEDLIPDVRVLITLTQRGSIKRQAGDVYRTQRRGGRGIRGVVTREQDVVRHILTCSSMDNLLFFTDRGKVYQLKAHEVPDASRTSKGLALVNFVSLEPEEQVTSVLAVPDFEDSEYLVMATRNGKIKRTLIKEYSQVRSNGLIAIGLDEGDELGWVAMSHGNEDILLTTASGRTVRFRQEEVRAMGRPAGGVNGVNLNKADYVVGMSLMREGGDLLVVTAKGFGKRSALEEYPVKGRATTGVITIRLRSNDDHVAGAVVVTNASLLTFITHSGIVMRTAAEGISRYGRATQGVTIVNLSKGDRVAGLTQEVLDDLNGNGSDPDTQVLIDPSGDE